ncbi:mCG147083, partial [Mus musculus]
MASKHARDNFVATSATIPHLLPPRTKPQIQCIGSLKGTRQVCLDPNINKLLKNKIDVITQEIHVLAKYSVVFEAFFL